MHLRDLLNKLQHFKTFNESMYCSPRILGYWTLDFVLGSPHGIHSATQIITHERVHILIERVAHVERTG